MKYSSKAYSYPNELIILTRTEVIVAFSGGLGSVAPVVELSQVAFV